MPSSVASHPYTTVSRGEMEPYQDMALETVVEGLLTTNEGILWSPNSLLFQLLIKFEDPPAFELLCSNFHCIMYIFDLKIKVHIIISSTLHYLQLYTN